MAKCVRCGKKIGLFDDRELILGKVHCPDCYAIVRSEQLTELKSLLMVQP